MTKILTVFGLGLLLTGCAAVPRLSATDADRMNDGKSAVLFVDDIEQINYLQDKYYVLAVTQEGSTSAYKGIWNSGKELSAIHADEFSKLGLKAKSAYELFSAQDLESLIQENKNQYTLRPMQPGSVTAPSAKTITPQLREALLAKGQDYLIWSSWSGYTMHFQTLGLPTNGQFQIRYWIFDVKQNKLLGGGDVMWLGRVNLEGQTGKDFLEKNDLAGLRSQVEKQIRSRFESPPNATIGKVLGLKGST